MKGYLQFLIILVFVTRFPQNGNSQHVNSGTRLLRTTVNTTSSIIRFLGNSYIRYDLSVLNAEMLMPTSKESLSMQFITTGYDREGLMWIFNGRNGQKMHIVFKDGYLIFTYDDSRGSPQQEILRHPDSRVLNDFMWHTVRIDKDGRSLKFYIDNAYSSEMTTRSEVQFLSSGVVYLGGTDQTGVDTGGFTSSNFGGALTDVESTKVRGPSNELIISYLQATRGADKSGTIDIIPPGEWNDGSYVWGTTRPPPTTPPPARPTPVEFTTGSSMFYLRDPLDLRTGGSLSFRFRTLEPRGLLAIARGNIQNRIFFAMEIFDGLLYFVYDLGTLASRKLFTDIRVDDGEWHEVMMKVQGNQITLSISGRHFSVHVSQENILKMSFNRLFVGGYDDFSKAPWLLYNRQGYRGCIDSLTINNVGFDLHLFIDNPNLRGVQKGCQSMNRYCQTQPCVRGFCRDRMDYYVCDCSNTPYTGQNCTEDVVITGWDGTLSTTFNFSNREMTHTNDISFRFLTPLSDTILFRTEADNKDDFIQAHLADGKAEVTIKVDDQTRTFVSGNNLNDYFWHTLYIRRRAGDVEVWVDDEPHIVGVIGGENYQLFIDKIKFGAVENTGSLKANDYIGYMQNFIYDDQELFSLLQKQNSNYKWIINMPIYELPLLTYKPVTFTTSETYFQLPSLSASRTMKIMFKFKTRESNGLILYHTGEGNDVIAIELTNGQVRLAFNLGGRNMFTVVPTKILNDNMWHNVFVSLKNGQLSVTADNNDIYVTTSDGDRRLDLSGSLYIGGLPASMFSRPAVDNLIESKKGFRGCLASMNLNGEAPDLLRLANESQSVLNGCTACYLEDYSAEYIVRDSSNHKILSAGDKVLSADGIYVTCNNRRKDEDNPEEYIECFDGVWGRNISDVFCIKEHPSCPMVINSQLTGSFDDGFNVKCLEGYELEHEREQGNSFTCSWEGEWEPVKPVCNPEHPLCPMVVNSQLTGSFDDGFNVKCLEGYELEAEREKGNSFTCSWEGAWEPITPVCNPVSCSIPLSKNSSGELYNEEEDEVLRGSKIPHGSDVTLNCPKGYVPDLVTFSCQYGKWNTPDGKIPECVPANCSIPQSKNSPGQLYNEDGKEVLRDSEVPHGSDVILYCPKGHVPDLVTFSCQYGKWNTPDGKVPECDLVTCPKPTVVDAVYGPKQEEYIYGDKVTVVRCKGILTLEGSWELECQKFGNWSDTAVCKPFCEGGVVEFKAIENKDFKTDVSHRKFTRSSYGACEKKCRSYKRFLCASFVYGTDKGRHFCRIYPQTSDEMPVQTRPFWTIGKRECIRD